MRSSICCARHQTWLRSALTRSPLWQAPAIRCVPELGPRPGAQPALPESPSTRHRCGGLGAAHCSARNTIQSSRNAPKLVPARSPIGRSPVPKNSRTVRSRYADVWLFEARETCQKPFGRRTEDIAAYLEGALRHNKPFHAASVPVKRRKQRVGDS